MPGDVTDRKRNWKSSETLGNFYDDCLYLVGQYSLGSIPFGPSQDLVGSV
jgi:hypothetical protein